MLSLARAELYLTLATIFRRYEKQKLFETSRLDVDVGHDYLLPQPSEKSKGVKVILAWDMDWPIVLGLQSVIPLSAG